MSKIQFEEGVGDIEIFFMDTPKVRATGAGNVNLGAETIDFVVNPEHKKKLLFKKGSALRIDGPLRKPSVAVVPLSEAVKISGAITMPVVSLTQRGLGRLWSLIENDKEVVPCMLETR